jgi:uncharacterized membrane protein YuzA (DUF378 family)
MRHKYVLWYAGGATILVLVLAVSGVSLTPWIYVLVGLACPLMMMSMMGDMHDGGPRSGSGRSTDEDHNRLTGSGSD